MEKESHSFELDESELVAILFIIGNEVGWLCARAGSEQSEEIEFYSVAD